METDDTESERKKKTHAETLKIGARLEVNLCAVSVASITCILTDRLKKMCLFAWRDA